MKYRFVFLMFIITGLGFGGCAAEQYSQTARHHGMKMDTLRAMKTNDIIALSKAGVSDSLIIGMMDATDTWFQLKPQDVIDLRNAGVSEKVIAAMMQPPSSSEKSADSNGARYYFYSPYSWWWYDDWYPYWYYPRFSVRLGYRPYFHGFGGPRHFR